jgi:hypothetical protein
MFIPKIKESIDDRENNNYAKLLQKKLNADSVDNRAKPGISNDAIIQQLLSWSAEENHKNTFVVIGWTSPERAEIFPDTTILKENFSHWITLGPWIFSKWFKNSENYPIKKEYAKDVEFYYTMLRTKFSCYIDWIEGEVPLAPLPNWHYLHISQDVVPALLQMGVTDDQIDEMLIRTPHRFLDSVNQGGY